MSIEELWVWVQQHPLVVAVIVIYVFANIAPRPDPSKMRTGKQKAFWQMVDRLCVLTHDRLPGGIKLPLLDSRLPKRQTRTLKRPRRTPKP